MAGKNILLALLASSLFVCNVTAKAKLGYGKPVHPKPPLPVTTPIDDTFFQNEPVDELGQLSDTEKDEFFSFVSAFHEIVLSCAAFQSSLSAPLVQLVEDPSGSQGVTICKLSRARMILSAAINKLLESYHHWATLGTSLEEPTCRKEAQASLEAFTLEAARASNDLTDLDMGSVPKTAFEQFYSLLVKINSEFTEVPYY